jgi:hypothetical protein
MKTAHGTCYTALASLLNRQEIYCQDRPEKFTGIFTAKYYHNGLAELGSKAILMTFSRTEWHIRVFLITLGCFYMRDVV